MFIVSTVLGMHECVSSLIMSLSHRVGCLLLNHWRIKKGKNNTPAVCISISYVNVIRVGFCTH